MTTAFGLDITTTSVKAVSLKRVSNALVLDSVGVLPISTKGVMSESVVDQQMLADSIKKLIESAQIKTNAVNVALPESQVYVKIIEMPDLSEHELTAALRWEMEQYVPLPEDQVRTAWQIMGKKQGEGKKTMDVLLIAAPITVIKKYEDILSLANLIPQTVETEILSIHRAVYPLLNTPDTCMIVNLGASTTDVAITKGGVLKMIFSIGVGGAAITRAISLDLGVDIIKAEEYKRTVGLNQSMLEGKVSRSLAPILDSIAQDLKKTIFSYKEKNPAEQIKQLILSGGSAQIPAIDSFLTNTLNIPVVLGNSFKLYNISNVPDQVSNDFASYNVVIGLALKDLV